MTAKYSYAIEQQKQRETHTVIYFDTRMRRLIYTPPKTGNEQLKVADVPNRNRAVFCLERDEWSTFSSLRQATIKNEFAPLAL